MGENGLRYDRMVERALRGVMRDTLTYVAERGLPGAHHFYVTFRTDHPRAQVDTALKARFPEEMTIVLQHQFYDLAVEDDGFSVTLSFNNVLQRLWVPFAAVTSFSDPSVNFGLQFQAVVDGVAGKPAPAASLGAGGAQERDAGTPKPPVQAQAATAKAPSVTPLPKPPAPAPVKEPAPPAEKVVTLDSFRKK